MRRKECDYPGCDKRKYAREMAKVKWFAQVGMFETAWTSAWVCREHLPHLLLKDR